MSIYQRESNFYLQATEKTKDSANAAIRVLGTLAEERDSSSRFTVEMGLVYVVLDALEALMFFRSANPSSEDDENKAVEYSCVAARTAYKEIAEIVNNLVEPTLYDAGRVE